MAGTRTRKAFMTGGVVLAACAVAAGALVLTSHHEPAHPRTTHQTAPACFAHKAWQKGSFCTGVALADVRKATLAQFTAATGVLPGITEYYQHFGTPFSPVNANLVTTVGARPFIQINPRKVSIADIAAGHFDKYLKTYADAVKAYGNTVILSFGHEMNGSWSTWSLPFTSPQSFVAAYRHIVKVFRHQHVKNVLWAWDISHSGKKPKAWWPGGKYVDIVGIDGYVREHQTATGQFWKIIGDVRHLTNNKPVMITETGVAPGPDQAKQILALFTAVKQRRLMGLIWFNINKKRAWRLTVANKAADAAFRKGADG